MNLDELLKSCSRNVFSNLEEEEYRILKILAKGGFCNLKEIGEKTSTYCASFGRWGVKKRLYGTSRFIGLIPHNYVSENRINKKETKYGLTTKGVLAILSQIKFNKIFIIQRYLRFLSTYVKKTNEVNFLLDYIKYEIAYVLYYNDLQGLNLTKFHYLNSYLNNLKNLRTPITLSAYDSSKNQEQNDFEKIKDEYLKKFYAVNLIYSDISSHDKSWDDLLRIWNNDSTLELESQKIRYIFTRYWHEFLYLFEIPLGKEKMNIVYDNILSGLADEKIEEIDRSIGMDEAKKFVKRQRYS
jgi:hypothetical protein